MRARLADAGYQDQVAAAIADGVARFAREREALARRLDGQPLELEVSKPSPVPSPTTVSAGPVPLRHGIGSGPFRPGIMAQTRSAP